MYQDEIFETAKQEARVTAIKGVQKEVKNIEQIIEKMLTHLLECSSTISERDVNVCSI